MINLTLVACLLEVVEPGFCCHFERLEGIGTRLDVVWERDVGYVRVMCCQFAKNRMIAIFLEIYLKFF